MHVTVITPPAAFVTTDEAKAHLRVDYDEEDTLITSLVAAATGWIDGPAGWLGHSIGMQTLEARFEAFCGDEIRLPYGPVISPIGSIKYLDGDGVEQTFSSSSYTLLSDGRVRLNSGSSWPSLYDDPEAVRVRYQAGYTTVPEPIKQAILLLIGHWFHNREEVVTGTITAQLPMSAQALLSTFRRWPL